MYIHKFIQNEYSSEILNKNVEKSVSKVENLSFLTRYYFKTEIRCGKVRLFNVFNRFFNIGKKITLQSKKLSKVFFFTKNSGEIRSYIHNFMIKITVSVFRRL